MRYTAEERENLIRRYEQGPGRIRAALKGTPKPVLLWKPGPRRWSVHEIVCHCADSETVAAVRLRFLLAEDNPQIAGYDQDRWSRVFEYSTMPIEPALAAIDAVRATTSLLLRRLPEEAWGRKGQHPEYPTYGVEDWLRIYAEHLEKHAGQIERNVGMFQMMETHEA
jgi:hypothetical protein